MLNVKTLNLNIEIVIFQLKELQAKRKEVRAQQEKELAEQKREEEERVRREEAEKKAREAEEKRRRLEEAEKKRQTMVQSQREKMDGYGSYDKGKLIGVNYSFIKIQQKIDDDIPTLQLSNMQDAKKEKIKTKEQQEEDKKIALSIRVKPMDVADLGLEGLKTKTRELWENIIRLETEKYDLEERQRRQRYDVRLTVISSDLTWFSILQLQELETRQTQRLRLKAVRMGLDAE